ncbi:M12 family metallopeptidase [Deinococcus cellulosilyticus]|uniref:Peptidase M12A domain-containing protein n=1 Tax=Deinococcus cellulosilyticus (strain DSM 18568 / NBRC 106333 / KACC 11606 / 5516J-15) TaxID=1223518 RepID=A0A511NAU8_DEIC1|nr:M12 family metallopeptidase [Deinococcus cellulosilyticus]GEM49954.1 hypothetical protein DC3_55890 [Deinococcus cellulosilyticus NBRC 106333 = KACC 11606]
MNSKNLIAAGILGSLILASCGTTPAQNQEMSVKSHTFSNGETFSYTEYDGIVKTDDDVIVANSDELSGLFQKYEAYLSTPEVDKNGVGITKYCSFEFITCWSYTDNRWPSGKIYYSYDGTLTSTQKNNILTAITDWNSRVSDVKWYYSPAAGDRVVFTKETDPNACGSSSIGKKGGAQQLRLSCFSKGVIQHEMGHAAGLLHEQSRCDRDSFVTILWANIKSGYSGNFNKACGEAYKDYGSYNYNSVMHYGAKAFSSNGGYTIVPKNGVSVNTIGQREALHAGDVSALNQMY